MKVKRFEPTDFKELAGWGKAWGGEYSEELFPKTGFIVPGVAAFFLYATDSKVCYLENLVCNPGRPRCERDQALSLITEALLKEAKEQGFKTAYACTNIGAVIERALLMGATLKTNHALLTKDLS